MPKSIFLFIPAIFIVLLLAAISSKYQLTPKLPQVLPTITPAPSLFHEPPWQTYTNDDYGLTIQYPASWKVIGALMPDAGNSVSFIPPQGSFIVLSAATDDSQSIVDYLSKKDNEFRKNNNGRSFEKVISIEEGVIGGYMVVKRREYWETSNFETYVTYFKHNQTFISIYLFPPRDSDQKISQSEKEIYNQILSTFKFISQATPTIVTKDVFHLNSKTVKIGNIKKVYQKNNQSYIDIDYIEWINDDSMPNGYGIKNDNPLIRIFKLTAETEINCLDIYDAAVPTKIDAIELNKTISGDSNICFNTNLFKIDFDQAGQVNWLMQVYAP